MRGIMRRLVRDTRCTNLVLGMTARLLATVFAVGCGLEIWRGVSNAWPRNERHVVGCVVELVEGWQMIRIQHARIQAKRLRTGAPYLAKPKAVRTPTPCSCWMCGNPRKWFGDATVQERSFAQTQDWQ